MSAINFVVRDSAGNLQRGFLGGDTESNILNAGAGNDISLNLRRSQVLDYAREGNDLIITLSDGRELTLSNYFPNGVEAQNELYLSADGFMNEVALIDDPVDGLRAQYILLYRSYRTCRSDDETPDQSTFRQVQITALVLGRVSEIPPPFG